MKGSDGREWYLVSFSGAMHSDAVFIDVAGYETGDIDTVRAWVERIKEGHRPTQILRADSPSNVQIEVER